MNNLDGNYAHYLEVCQRSIKFAGIIGEYKGRISSSIIDLDATLEVYGKHFPDHVKTSLQTLKERLEKTLISTNEKWDKTMNPEKEEQAINI
jgi:hypothetical protein